jgi:predicted TIM-barrel fold metal-dependent hydrolase
MTYADGRVIHDADSHLMEWPDWLAEHADPDVRDQLGPVEMHGMEEEALEALAAAEAAQLQPLVIREDELMLRKNWAALGAFDPAERSAALDLLGFSSQLVFSTYSHLPLMRLPYSPGIVDNELLYAATRAHNRGVAEFCEDDPRLLAVAWVPLDEPELAVRATREALDLGCAAVEVASYPIGPRSLTHVEFDPMYGLLEQAGRPLVFHVGGGGRLVSPIFAETGRETQTDERKHAPLLPALTSMGIPAPVEMAVAALVLDGVFETHPGLMCGVIEQGATWLPGFLRRLDQALGEFGGRTERGRLTLEPSEYVLRQVRLTPFPYEDVSWLIEQSSADLYLFSTDYPHDEGGTDPLACFRESLRNRSEEERDRFYRRNFEQLMGAALPAEARG